MTTTTMSQNPAKMPQVHANPVRTRRDWEAQRAAAMADPGAFHGAIAKREIHWFVASAGASGAWLTYDETSRLWTGWSAGTGAAVTADWNSVHLIVRGNTLIHTMNGRVMSITIDDDAKGRVMEGMLGVQVHVGPPMKVEYKNWRLKPL